MITLTDKTVFIKLCLAYLQIDYCENVWKIAHKTCIMYTQKLYKRHVCSRFDYPFRFRNISAEPQPGDCILTCVQPIQPTTCESFAIA